MPDEAVDLAMAAGESAASEAAAEYGVGNVTMITKDDGKSRAVSMLPWCRRRRQLRPRRPVPPATL